MRADRFDDSGISPGRGFFNARATNSRTWFFSISTSLLFLPGIFLLSREFGSTVSNPLLFLPILIVGTAFGAPGIVSSTLLVVLGTGPVQFIFFGPAIWLFSWDWVVAGVAFSLFGAAIAMLNWYFHYKVYEVLRESTGKVSSSTISGIYNKVLASLANAVEVRDQHTQGHCRRVADNSIVIGRASGMLDDSLDTLYWGAMLHDLGKIAIPEYVLTKQGRLTDEEFNEIKRHPTYGANLLASISSDFIGIAEVVRTHHERWDGYGYPFGFKGDEIPIAARIIAIVDVFEALTSYRPYRSPMPAEEAVVYIRSGAGTQFDPALVPLFETLFHQGYIEYYGTPTRTPISTSGDSVSQTLTHTLGI